MLRRWVVSFDGPLECTVRCWSRAGAERLAAQGRRHGFSTWVGRRERGGRVQQTQAA